MRYLLDTHTFLWFTLDDPALSRFAKTLIEDPANEIEISPATYWEIAIKIGNGKYSLPAPFTQFMEQQLLVNDFKILPITIQHASALIQMPKHHKDPFDRILVAQSLVESIPIVSGDVALDAYGVTRNW